MSNLSAIDLLTTALGVLNDERATLDKEEATKRLICTAIALLEQEEKNK